MSSLLLQKHLLSICLILFASFAAAQGTDKPPVCASPEDVLQHYIDAVGGKAVYDIQSRTITAKESNRGFGNEHYIYKIKWKAPNKVAAGSTPYLFNALPVSYPNGTFIFDGEDWSNFDRRRSRNEEREPEGQRALKHKNPCNEDPQATGLWSGWFHPTTMYGKIPVDTPKIAGSDTEPVARPRLRNSRCPTVGLAGAVPTPQNRRLR